MFFVGIMGIGNKEKMITEVSGITCKACGGYGRYTAFKRYSYFHMFFIPVWKWGIEYYVRERTCNTIFRLKEETGIEIEKDVRQEIYSHEITELHQVQRCEHCKQALDDKFVYCPYCGKDR